MLLVLAEGEPEESFPKILLYDEIKVKDDDGKEVTVKVDREPLAADCRGDNDKERLKAMDNVVLKLCAAIFNLNYDDLKQRHRERQVRRRIIALSAALAIVTVFAITCLSFSLEISRQNKVISDKYAGSMAAVAEELLARGLRKDAVYAVRSVLPDKAEKGYNADAFLALSDALAPYEIEAGYYPEKSFPVPWDMTGISLSSDSSLALINASGYSVVTDIASGKRLRRINSEEAVLTNTGVAYLSDDLSIKELDIETGEETVLAMEEGKLCYSPSEDILLVFTAEGVAGFRGTEKVFEEDFFEWGIDDPDVWAENVFVTNDGKYAAFVVNGFDDAWVGLISVADGQLKMCVRTGLYDYPIVASDGKTVYLYYEETSLDAAGRDIGRVAAFDTSSGSLLSDEEIPGNGFYKMIISEKGLLLVSDRLAYMLDTDLSYLAAITGYMDSVCAFPYENGFGILDGLGRLFIGDAYSSYEASYLLYGHSEVPVLMGLYDKGSFYIRYKGNDRMVIYNPVEEQREAMEDIGDARAFDGNSGKEAELDGLEGIDEIGVDHAGASDDGKYIAVSSIDGILYIFDAAEGKKVREIYDSGVNIFHNTFPYLGEAGVYIIENGVFDEDFNMIAKLPWASVSGVGNDEKSVVLRSPTDPDSYYSVTILPYEEIIERADSILDGYSPDRRICEKYNISHEHWHSTVP